MSHREVEPGSTENRSSGEHSTPEFPGRRSFIGLLLGVGTVVVGALLSVPLFRFVFFPVFHKTTGTQWADAGAMSDFASLAAPVNKDINVEQVDAWRQVYSQKSVFVVPGKNKGEVEVLSPVCPHLGCLVHYNSDDKQFLCPCHGSIFAADGSVVKGPSLRGLDPLQQKTQNGRLMVLYQYFQELIKNRVAIG